MKVHQREMGVQGDDGFLFAFLGGLEPQGALSWAEDEEAIGWVPQGSLLVDRT